VSAGLPSWIPDLLPRETRERLSAALAGDGAVRATSMARAGRLIALAALLREAPRPLLVVAPSESDARSIAASLDPLGNDAGPGVVRLPATDGDPYRGMAVHPGVAARRVAALDALARGACTALVTSAPALLVPVPAPRVLAGWGREISPGVELDVASAAREAVRDGYRVVDTVSSPGDFARRGGLFDVWPPQETNPLRVELFGDEVESVRRFDSVTQRTIERIDAFRLLPASEAPIDPRRADRVLDRLFGRARGVLAADFGGETDSPARIVEERLAGLEAVPRLYVDDADLAPLASLFSAVVVWEPEASENALDRTWDELEAAHAESVQATLPAPAEVFESLARTQETVRGAPLALAELPLVDDAGRTIVDLRGRTPPHLEGRLDALPDSVRAATAAGRPVVLLARASGRRDRLVEILRDAELEPRLDSPDEPWPPSPGEIVVAPGGLDEGVELGDAGALVLAEADLFGPDTRTGAPSRRRAEHAFISDLRDLKIGDLVVHVDHGVARYLGLTKRDAAGDELLQLEYSGGDRLFVPVTRLDLVQKYSGGESSLVPLDKLGGTGWERRRSRVRKSVEKIAGELLSLYAHRQAVRAHAFGPDSEWQREFEAAFPHPLTSDQAAALREIKNDLRRRQPMDRLLCGDVGYGKTEVALRAAFKVVQEGQQVALLVPTTVLAFQHLSTVRARMSSWPVRVEMVSRFTPAAETREILQATARGEVDVLIGTHRLLSKDVTFRRLGLLIVDEEQRFGVKQKEQIKRLSIGTHVLAMTATPIPRTLQMSLAGVRDLSVIETPPRNRLAIQTRLAPRSETTIAAAINNEIKRGGQVFYIHPRVQGIENEIAALRELAPGVSIGLAHGQMPEHSLERAMIAFVRGETQVLVATTIIENGLDIPRANTIIVNEAHRFGLSQLYQMRGRVGRSEVRAYAFLLVPTRGELNEDARRRLAALVEFSDLGAGFRIAALDLEIRGAGEFLGARQSGHIAAVGFEMYVGMLEKEVRRLRGQPIEHAPEPVQINLGIACALPEDLVPEPGQRLEIYKRLAGAHSDDEVERLENETADRFGRLPEPARNLFRLARLRLVAMEQGAVSVDWAEGGIAVRYGEQPKVDTDKIIAMMHSDDDVRLTPGGVLKMRVPDERADRIAAASLALRKLAS
jgi:transcription-repair coupling factor (superfamily II helicase)